MNAYDQKNECCGCMACLNACPQKAIVMQTDSEGFFYPQTDERFCINCGICKKFVLSRMACRKIMSLLYLLPNTGILKYLKLVHRVEFYCYFRLYT